MQTSTWRTRGRIPFALWLCIGEPVDLTAVRAAVAAGRPIDAQLLRETTEQMMARVRDQLSELRGVPAPRAVHPAPRRELPGDLSGSAA
ncbi:hypothetical protein GCU60_11805 [Blastococcus saxobsidens]|uniref:Uncharacterized protein n=1 Tax=Blastococcus saxobsidens TaxID=138336 RepID=A0A6L9W356_9ACTN|nr:hypothetical protein [Blastococcus saxobsidens]NEK86433.1 hypothetical protein [Blastococcus saxobsidens]